MFSQFNTLITLSLFNYLKEALPPQIRIKSKTPQMSLSICTQQHMLILSPKPTYQNLA
jgi:hypothetical protein